MIRIVSDPRGYSVAGGAAAGISAAAGRKNTRTVEPTPSSLKAHTWAPSSRIASNAAGKPEYCEASTRKAFGLPAELAVTWRALSVIEMETYSPGATAG